MAYYHRSRHANPFRFPTVLALTQFLSPRYEQPRPGRRHDPLRRPSELDAQFQRTMTNATLSGQFTIDGDDQAPKKDAYTIASVKKLKGNLWLFNARIQFGAKDVTLPLILPVLWAGDTPIITVTDVGVPGIGSYTARVIIYDDHYAGTWSGGPTHRGCSLAESNMAARPRRRRQINDESDLPDRRRKGAHGLAAPAKTRSASRLRRTGRARPAYLVSRLISSYIGYLLVMAVLVFFVPRFEPVFKDFKMDLPRTTVLALASRLCLRDYLWAFLLPVPALWATVNFYIPDPNIRRRLRLAAFVIVVAFLIFTMLALFPSDVASDAGSQQSKAIAI